MKIRFHGFFIALAMFAGKLWCITSTGVSVEKLYLTAKP